MPLRDGYTIDKALGQEAEEIGKSIVEFYETLGVTGRGFVLFLVDQHTGTVNYISDIDRHLVNSMLRHWLSKVEPTN